MREIGGARLMVRINSNIMGSAMCKKRAKALQYPGLSKGKSMSSLGTVIMDLSEQVDAPGMGMVAQASEHGFMQGLGAGLLTSSKNFERQRALMELSCGLICFVGGDGEVHWHESFGKGEKRGGGPFEGLDAEECDRLVEEFELGPEDSELGLSLARLPARRRFGWGKGFDFGGPYAQAMSSLAAQRIYCLGDHEMAKSRFDLEEQFSPPWVLDYEDLLSWGCPVDAGGHKGSTSQERSSASWQIAVAVGEVSACMLALSAKVGSGYLSYSNVYWRALDRWLVYCSGISGCPLPSDGVWIPVSQALAFEGVPRGLVTSRGDLAAYLNDPTEEDKKDWLSLWRATGGRKCFEGEAAARAALERWEMEESSEQAPCDRSSGAGRL